MCPTCAPCSKFNAEQPQKGHTLLLDLGLFCSGCRSKAKVRRPALHSIENGSGCFRLCLRACAEPHLNRTAGQFAFAPQANWSALILVQLLRAWVSVIRPRKGFQFKRTTTEREREKNNNLCLWLCTRSSLRLDENCKLKSLDRAEHNWSAWKRGARFTKR